ncbi:MAG: ThiF family adenylyltransferase [Methanomassiliicoccaceae archaeon]|jgi:molybdopterin/thiamine biosynthesis adenylyltransferase|nr:ThiF family adenylyltransferase [Methanomassiliicoccaceae archaeon]
MISAREYDKDRFDRSKRIEWLDMDAIGDCRCLVVGAGALGNEAVKCLVLSGFRDITIVDMDDIVLSNLNRCVFFRSSDVKNGLKADILAERASRLDPDVTIRSKRMRIQELERWDAFGIVIGCLDNISARLHVNAHSYYHKIPYVDGGTDGMTGKIQVVLPGGPCLQCSMNRTHYKALETRFSCTGKDAAFYVPKMAAEITTTSVIAAMQVREAMKIMSGREDMCVKNMSYYDGISGETFTLEVKKDERCENHEHEV